MSRKRYPPDDPREWLNRARSNLLLARAVGLGAFLEDLCFEAQQCAEKAVKAVFVSRRETFPYIHKLKRLLDVLENNGVKVPRFVLESDELSPYAAITRYPDGIGPVSQRQYRRAVRIATAVLGWAERQVAASSAGPKKKK